MIGLLIAGTNTESIEALTGDRSLSRGTNDTKISPAALAGVRQQCLFYEHLVAVELRA